MVTPRYLKKKGDNSGRVMIFTSALKPMLDAGDLIEISNEDAMILIEKDKDRRTSYNNVDRKFVKRKGDDRSPIMSYTPAFEKMLKDGVLEFCPDPAESVTDPTPNLTPEVIVSTGDKTEEDAGKEPEIPANTVAVQAQIVEVIKGLDMNDENFTVRTKVSEPKPRVEAIEKILRFNISADERDAAWKAFQEQG